LYFSESKKCQETYRKEKKFGTHFLIQCAMNVNQYAEIQNIKWKCLFIMCAMPTVSQLKNLAGILGFGHGNTTFKQFTYLCRPF